MTKLKNPTASDVRKAYIHADDKGKRLLKDLYGDDVCNVDITDLVKSFEDACEILSIDPDLPDASMLPEKDGKSIIAYYKLTVIIRALNEGWVPIWKDGGCNTKYWAWFDGRVLARSCYGAGTQGGVAYASASHDSASTVAFIASRLAFRGVIREAESVAAFKALPLL